MVKTFTADIYLGLAAGYTDKCSTIDEVREICDSFVEKGLCVTIQQTEFRYTGGSEPGAIIGLINYPRFPKTETQIMFDATDLANLLMEELNQFRCTIVTSEWTYLLENKNMPKEFEDK